MTLRIGINGFGRIGRVVTRILHQRGLDVEIVAINDLTHPDQLAHSLKYDSVYHRFPGEVGIEGDQMRIGPWRARVTAIKDPAELGWGALGVDVVIESTGVFRKRADVQKHIDAGAKKVILTVPPKDELDAIIVLGVNDGDLTGSEKMVSNASCTTNAAAPLTKALHDAFTVKRGVINTIHAYTNDQRLIDYPHSDWRRSRSAALSIIPTTTGAAKAVAKVIPELKGKLDGGAYRVPTPVGSIVDMVLEVSRNVTVEEVNAAVKAAADGPMKGILQYEDDPIVSVDIIGNPHSSIFDAGSTQIIDGNLIKAATWYDNEWGYSNRVIDLALKLAK